MATLPLAGVGWGWDLQREADASTGAQKVRPQQRPGRKPFRLLLLLFKLSPAMDKMALMSQMVGFFFFFLEALEWPVTQARCHVETRPEKGREGSFYKPLSLHTHPPSCTSAFPRAGL